MKRILLFIAVTLTSSMLYSQNVNYIVEVVNYWAGIGTDDGWGGDEELTWKSWGKDNTAMTWEGGVCEPLTGNAPIIHNTHSNVVLLQDSNSVATSLQFRLEAWEDDDITNGIGDPDRCTYNGGGGLNGDDNYELKTFTAFDFRAATQCDWKTYSFITDNEDFRLTIRVKWEYTGSVSYTHLRAHET